MAYLPVRESRNTERERINDHDRVVLLEQDADKNERQHAEILGEIRGMKNMLLAVVISAASATIVGAINLVIGRVGT